MSQTSKTGGFWGRAENGASLINPDPNYRDKNASPDRKGAVEATMIVSGASPSSKSPDSEATGSTNPNKTNSSNFQPITNFGIGDTVFSDINEALPDFLKRVGGRFLELTEENEAEISCRIFQAEKGMRYALVIETSGLPQVTSSSASAPIGYKVMTGNKTVHTHAGEVRWTNALARRTRIFIERVSKGNRNLRAELMRKYYTPFERKGRVPAGGNVFSTRDIKAGAGYLISANRHVWEQNGKGTEYDHGSF